MKVDPCNKYLRTPGLWNIDKRSFRAINIGMSDENILHMIFFFADKLHVTRV